jgi:ABC-type transporter Mla subunit MlaD
MRGAREQVASKLEAMDRRENAPTNAVQDVARLLERIREMVQDATRKGERLSATGERASRSAEGLLRVLETESRELAGLVARLSPLTASEPQSTGAKSPGLRLLGEEEAQGPRRDERRQPESGEERR